MGVLQFPCTPDTDRESSQEELEVDSSQVEGKMGRTADECTPLARPVVVVGMADTWREVQRYNSPA